VDNTLQPDRFISITLSVPTNAHSRTGDVLNSAASVQGSLLSRHRICTGELLVCDEVRNARGELETNNLSVHIRN
jgi:hypothetical protein